MFEMLNLELFLLVAKAFVIFTSLPVHGFASAWVAVKCGDNTPKQYGKLTLNPFVHLDLIGCICMILVGYGWGKPVEVDSRNFKNPKVGNILFSLARPVSSLLLAFLWIIIGRILSIFTESIAISFIVQYSARLNIGLAVFMLSFVALTKLAVFIVHHLSPQIQYKFFANPHMFHMILLLIVWVTPVSIVITTISSNIYDLFYNIVYFIG
ncbi:MAG: site-2 protease family protein [Oscillospiraceae bacterium]|nr:site-2 protease family protein [Oscillospiraceae bacterium]